MTDYPPQPCPDDPDGLHHIGCGCEWGDDPPTAADEARELIDRAYTDLVALHGPPPTDTAGRRRWFARHRPAVHDLCARYRAETRT